MHNNYNGSQHNTIFANDIHQVIIDYFNIIQLISAETFCDFSGKFQLGMKLAAKCLELVAYVKSR